MTKQTTRSGVIGAGSFGTAVANLVALNTDVLLFTRNPDTLKQINTHHKHLNTDLSPRIIATDCLETVAKECALIFPILPSGNFRSVIRQMAPFLKPHHVLIHGTKGFDLTILEEQAGEPLSQSIDRSGVQTMSEVIREETSVVRIGCLSGPNLSTEIMEGQPAATVVASRFEEVINAGQRALNSTKFHVYGSQDILGAEVAGALKNIVALGSGMLAGMGLGRNMQGLLIARGLAEMIYFGKCLGASAQAFMGVAGIGDLVATSTSTNSRNYRFGTLLGSGMNTSEIREKMPELAEGVRTLQIARMLGRHYKLHVPITDMLYAIVYDGYPKEKAIEYLMTYPYAVDVDFL